MHRLSKLLLAAAAFSLSATSCAPRSSSVALGDKPELRVQQRLTPRDLDELSSRAKRFADLYISRINQACDDIENKTENPAIRRAVRDMKIRQGYAALSSAMGSNPVLDLLDLTVQAALGRRALEEYLIPAVLGDIGAPLLRAATQSEQEAWQILGTIFTEAHIKEVRSLIERWWEQNPDTRYTSRVRFSDFSQYIAASKSPQSTSPGSVFSLLYLNPLSNLDPVAAEVRESRLFAERLTYLLQRMPLIIQWQAEATAAGVLESTSVERFLAHTAAFSEATAKFAKTTENYPQALAKERDAAIHQLSDAVATERTAAIKNIAESLDSARKLWVADLEKQQQLFAERLGQLDQSVQTAHDGIVRLTDGSQRTVREAETSARELMTRAFWLLLVLIVVILIGLPISIRLSRRR